MLRHNLVIYLRRYNMATGRASKKAKKLLDMHQYLHGKVEQVERERTGDRSWGTKQHLINLKKQKLAIKDKISK